MMGAKKKYWVSLFLHVSVVVDLFRLVQAQCSSSGVILSASSGSFNSPNYPSNYPNSRTCRWIIVVQDGHRVQLTFQTFVLETCVTSVCTCDHVEIRDGSDGSSPSFGRFCGNNKPSPIHSSGRSLWIEFDSDLTTNEKGFSATYTTIAMSTTVPSTTLPGTSTTASPAVPPTTSRVQPTPPSDAATTPASPGKLTTASPDTTPTTTFPTVQAQCNKDGFILTGSSGSFSSPNYPSNYPNSRTCRWIIGVQQGHRVQLTFQTFLLETCVTSVCTCDHVEIRDGSDGSSPSLGRFCSDNKPSPIQSSGRFLWIEFDSDLTTNEKGFSATYVAVAIPTTFPATNLPAIPTTFPATNLPERIVCSDPKHPASCSNSLTPICCHDNGPSCCRTGGSRCIDGAATRDYCPRPSDDPSKGKCCLDDNGEPSCCEDRTDCWLGFIGLKHLSPSACIGATAGLVIGGIVALLLVGFCCIMLMIHPEKCCIFICWPCIACWECCVKPFMECLESACECFCSPCEMCWEYCIEPAKKCLESACVFFCIPCVMCWECCENPVKKCKGCRKCRGCRRCDCSGWNCCESCGDCDCGGCNCSGWNCCESCGDCDCGGCNCSGWNCCDSCGDCDCGGCNCCDDCGNCCGECCSECGKGCSDCLKCCCECCD